MEIKKYKINLYNCKNNHKKENISFEEVDKFLNFDLSKIFCENCKVKKKIQII